MPGFPWRLPLAGPQSSKTRVWSGACRVDPFPRARASSYITSRLSQTECRGRRGGWACRDGEPRAEFLLSCVEFVVTDNRRCRCSRHWQPRQKFKLSLAGNKVAIRGGAAPLVSSGIRGVWGTGGTRARLHLHGRPPRTSHDFVRAVSVVRPRCLLPNNACCCCCC